MSWTKIGLWFGSSMQMGAVQNATLALLQVVLAEETSRAFKEAHINVSLCRRAPTLCAQVRATRNEQ